SFMTLLLATVHHTKRTLLFNAESAICISGEGQAVACRHDEHDLASATVRRARTGSSIRPRQYGYLWVALQILSASCKTASISIEKQEHKFSAGMLPPNGSLRMSAALLR